MSDTEYNLIKCCPGCRQEVIAHGNIITTHNGRYGRICSASRMDKRDAYAQLHDEMRMVRMLASVTS